jgi:hypothetical protein
MSSSSLQLNRTHTSSLVITWAICSFEMRLFLTGHEGQLHAVFVICIVTWRSMESRGLADVCPRGIPGRDTISISRVLKAHRFLCFLIDRGFQLRDERERAVSIREVQAITHHPDIWDLEPQIVNRDIELIPRLLEQHTGF